MNKMNPLTELAIAFIFFLLSVVIALFAEQAIRWWYRTGMTVVSKLGLKASNEPDQTIIGKWTKGLYHRSFMIVLRVAAAIVSVFLLLVMIVLLQQLI